MLHMKYVSDFVCPYCYAARQLLLKAVEGHDIIIEWLPYESTPTNNENSCGFQIPI